MRTNVQTYDQYLIDVAAEEAFEIGQRLMKVKRFGIEEAQPGQDKTNRERLEDEINDFLGVVSLLQKLNIIGAVGDEKALEAKRQRIYQYATYSFERGLCEKPAFFRRIMPEQCGEDTTTISAKAAAAFVFPAVTQDTYTLTWDDEEGPKFLKFDLPTVLTKFNELLVRIREFRDTGKSGYPILKQLRRDRDNRMCCSWCGAPFPLNAKGNTLTSAPDKEFLAVVDADQTLTGPEKTLHRFCVNNSKQAGLGKEPGQFRTITPIGAT